MGDGLVAFGSLLVVRRNESPIERHSNIQLGRDNDGDVLRPVHMCGQMAAGCSDIKFQQVSSKFAPGVCRAAAACLM